MAQPGPPPLCAPVSGPASAASSASPSFLAISDEARFLSSFLDRTRDLISFTPTQLSSLSPRECDDLALGHATILPLLCSAIHAISAIGVRIEDLFSVDHTLESQVANSLVDQELRDLRNTVRDLSHRVAPSIVRALPSQTPLPQQGSRQALSRPNVVPAPTIPIPFSSHPPEHSRAPPASRSYADVIHGGTSELDQAAADNAARHKGKAKPKTQSSGTSAVKVADAVEAASPKGPPPLPSVSRRFYALRTVQAPHPDEALIRIRWPDLAASVLREANSDLPVAFKTFVNDKGAVSLVFTDTAVPAASYAPFFEALSLKVNQSFPVGDNPWLPFRLAPTDLQFAIHGIPLDALLDEDDLLFPHIQSSIYNSKNLFIRSARYHNLDPSSCRNGKRACSVVVHVSPDHADRMVNPPSVLLYGSNQVVERAYPSSPSTQCHNCWKFGHVKPRCKSPVICPFCAGNHPKSEHRCSNPSCPKEGNLRPVLNCCVSSSPRCSNCDEVHSASDRDCSARPIPSPSNTPAADNSRAVTPPPAASSAQEQDDPNVIDTRPDSARPPAAPLTPAPAGSSSNAPSLAPAFDLTTPKALRRPQPERDRSTSRTSAPRPEEEPSPSPAPQDPSASRW